jgi:hypothetical protein
MNFDFFNIVVSLLALLVFGLLFYLFSRKRLKERIFEGLDRTLFMVTMPKYELKKEELMKTEEKNLIGQMEQIYANFLNLRHGLFKSPPTIALEIASQIGGTDILFYAAVPRFLENAFEKYVHGVYPRALVEKVPQDYTIFEPGGFTAGSYLKLIEKPFLPLNTYKNLEKDPISIITDTFSKITADEGAAIQLIIRPFPKVNWIKRGERLLFKIKEGKPVRMALLEATRNPIQDFIFELVGALFVKKSIPGRREDYSQYVELQKELRVDERIIKAIEEKIQKQVFETNIRLLASAKTRERADEILGHMEATFGQFSLFAFNSFSSRRVKGGGLRRLIYDFSFRNFSLHQKIILNVEELVSVYHFPTRFIETPYIKSIKSVVAPPPIELPEKGLNLIGKVIFRGEEKEVYFASPEDRRRHFYIVGQTGTGKTSLLRDMIRRDIQAGRGVGVIDPHGDLIEATLSNIPKERLEDVVLFEPFDMERPTGLNMLEYDTPEQKDFAVSEMIAIFHKLFPPEIIGPMFEHYMRNAMLALMADKEEPGTLVEIPRIFTDDEFMEYRLKKVTDPLVKNFWLKEWRQTTGETKSDMLGYVVSKVGRFVENEMMRNIIGQSNSGFDLAKIMDEGKIFLANLSKGLTGEINGSLLGLILVSKMQMAAMRRARIPEEQRRDFYLYIDEFQNFTTDSIVTILSEARKYRLNLILAHQYIPQLVQEIRNAVMGNVGTIASFRVGADDAEFLEKQFEPEFSRFDLVNLDNFTLIIKMIIENKISSPFKIQSVFPKKGSPEIIDPIKKLAKLKYGRQREIVEAEIAERSRLREL